MLLKELVKFANKLDEKGLKEQADTMDVIIAAIKKLLEQKGLDSFLEPSSVSEELEEKKDGESEVADKQFEAFGFKTSNFDICPKATSAFEDMIDKVGDNPSDSEEKHLLEALKKTDDLLQIEKNAINSDSITSREIDRANGLFREIIYNIGALSLEVKGELLSSFSFLDEHMDKIKSFKKTKENKDEPEE